jgi:hypothetical protein
VININLHPILHPKNSDRQRELRGNKIGFKNAYKSLISAVTKNTVLTLGDKAEKIKSGTPCAVTQTQLP